MHSLLNRTTGLTIMKKIYSLLFIVLVYCAYCDGQTITTFAGCGPGSGGFSGDGGPATAAHINGPGGATFDRVGNYYFAGDERVRKVSSAGIITTIAGNGIAGYSGDGIPATSAELSRPTDVALDRYDDIYIADYDNNRVRKIDHITGLISTVAGTDTFGYNGDGIPATSAKLYCPTYICFDTGNNMYISDWFNFRVRKVDAISGIISTVVGNGRFGYTSDGGLADTTTINGVWGIAFDSVGNLFMADYSNYRVRKVDVSTGIISTVVGNGNGWYNGEALPATDAQLLPDVIAFDRLGNLYISDNGNQVVRKLTASNFVYTVAGDTIGGYSGDGGPATAAEIWLPEGLAIDACGNIYISDLQNQRIRKVTFNPSCSSVDTASLNTSTINSIVPVSIYPNPTNNLLQIENIATPTYYSLLSIVGATLQHGVLKEGNNSISLNALPSGMYLLELIDDEGNKTVKKIIKE